MLFCTTQSSRHPILMSRFDSRGGNARTPPTTLPDTRRTMAGGLPADRRDSRRSMPSTTFFGGAILRETGIGQENKSSSSSD